MRRWLLVLVLVTSTSCKSFSEWVSLLGFTEIRAPSTLYAPGSLLLVENKEPYEAQLLCDVNEVLGVGYKPTISRTVTIGTTKKRSRTLTFNVDAATLAGGNVDVHAIRSVKVQMKDPRIMTVTAADVWARRKNISQNCLDALAALEDFDKSSKKKITMVRSVIAADASYSVDWDENAGLDVHAKVAQLESLAADLRLDASRVGSRTLSAQGVYWGIKDDMFLASMANPKNKARIPEGQRLLDPNSALDIQRPQTDAPPQAPQGLKPATSADVSAAKSIEQEPAIDTSAPEFVQRLKELVPYDPANDSPPTANDLDDAASHTQEDLSHAAPPGQGSYNAPSTAADEEDAPAPTRPISPRSRSRSGSR